MRKHLYDLCMIAGIIFLLSGSGWGEEVSPISITEERKIEGTASFVVLDTGMMPAGSNFYGFR